MGSENLRPVGVVRIDEEHSPNLQDLPEILNAYQQNHNKFKYL